MNRTIPYGGKTKRAYELVRVRVPVPDIIQETGLTKPTVMKVITKVWGRNAEYPGKRFRYSTESICWDCKKAVARCTWSRFFVPVDGWDAKETKIKTFNYEGQPVYIDSYKVYKCPEFEPDAPRY